jgi:hypothetical protein
MNQLVEMVSRDGLRARTILLSAKTDSVQYWRLSTNETRSFAGQTGLWSVEASALRAQSVTEAIAELLRDVRKTSTVWTLICLRWHGSCDRFRADDCHGRYHRRIPTLMLVSDTGCDIFDGFPGAS